jgi:hypothetical protein
VSPKFKKMAEYRRIHEQNQRQEAAVEQDEKRRVVKGRADHFVLQLEEFVEAKVRCMETNAIEDAVSLNKQREIITLAVVQIIEHDHSV